MVGLLNLPGVKIYLKKSALPRFCPVLGLLGNTDMAVMFCPNDGFIIVRIATPNEDVATPNNPYHHMTLVSRRCAQRGSSAWFYISLRSALLEPLFYFNQHLTKLNTTLAVTYLLAVFNTLTLAATSSSKFGLFSLSLFVLIVPKEMGNIMIANAGGGTTVSSWHSHANTTTRM